MWRTAVRRAASPPDRPRARHAAAAARLHAGHPLRVMLQAGILITAFLIAVITATLSSILPSAETVAAEYVSKKRSPWPHLRTDHENNCIPVATLFVGDLQLHADDKAAAVLARSDVFRNPIEELLRGRRRADPFRASGGKRTPSALSAVPEGASVRRGGISGSFRRRRRAESAHAARRHVDLLAERRAGRSPHLDRCNG